ncbi:hypothetical protein [Desertibacillus haloalkaliphilus]|uniref:hypothetical protein n=1 Tax=Desertibacillus haloalkaliphilus TaxID=1328930 RepID=UPI001C27DAD6|nr:hypothetical protein [Desertibacillus haloalkaliphilus]MBU8905730.1 hypothetical protein [Desertibacillus haloalkaliphilus]
MKKKRVLLLILIAFVMGFFLSFLTSKDSLRETLTFFPIDPNVNYLETSTSLQVLLLEDEDEYTLDWNTESSLDQVAYLRQDLSLLFEDGRLKETMSTWQEDSQSLSLEERVAGEDSGHFEAISFHHAEMHYPNDEIKSSQKMSYDQLYVIDSPLTPLQSFKEPSNGKEREAKTILDSIVSQQLNYVWNDLIDFYNVPTDKYSKLPLTQLKQYQDEPLPGLTQKETSKVIGGLWEGIYKNYFLGIKMNDGSVISPIGSSIPLILIHETSDHFIIVFQTKDGERVQLLQTLSP